MKRALKRISGVPSEIMGSKCCNFKLKMVWAKHTFFSSTHSSGDDHMLGQKTSLNKFKDIDVTPSIFPVYCCLRE